MKRLLFILAFLSLVVGAVEYKPLTGTYSIAGSTLYDPPTDEPKNTHIYFSLEGKPALDLYESMQTKAVRDKCADDGSTSKRIDQMQCTRSRDGKEYRCRFGIDIKAQKVVNGVVC